MALRSGYKGYKKLAEGLKEFWPGILGADIPALKKTFLDWSSYAKTGVHNLFDSSKAEFKDGGLTCTKNIDGSISIGAGTTTSELNYPNNATYANCYELEPSTEYIFSIGSAITNLRLRVFCKTTSSDDWTIIANEQSVENIHFTTPASFYAIWVRIDCDSNKAIPAATLYPMIRLATDTNPAFFPHAMTNVELTESVEDQKTVINAIITAAASAADFAAFKTAMGAITPVTRFKAREVPEEVKTEAAEEIEAAPTKKYVKKTKKKEEE